jgi:hypothetical protein
VPRQTLAAVVALSCASSLVLAQPGLPPGPPVPFEDAGACPFELCTYGDWTARRAVVVRRDRRHGSPVVFRVAPGEKVAAITGVVVTLEAGRVRFRVRHEMNSRSGRLVAMPGQILYLLTYQGEGLTKAWFDGRLYDELDGAEFFNAACEDDPGQCAGRIITQPRREWWAQLRNATGRVGWTDQAEAFSQPRVD